MKSQLAVFLQLFSGNFQKRWKHEKALIRCPRVFLPYWKLNSLQWEQNISWFQKCSLTGGLTLLLLFSFCLSGGLCLLFTDSVVLKKKAMFSTLPRNGEPCFMTEENQATQGSLHTARKSIFWNPPTHCFLFSQTDFYIEDCSWRNKKEITVEEAQYYCKWATLHD